MSVSLEVYAKRWRPHLAAASIAQLPALIPTVILVNMLLDAIVQVVLARSVDSLGPAVALSFALLVVTFFSGFAFVLMGAAASQMVQRWLAFEEVSLVDAYAMALRRFWRLAGAMLTAFAMICGGFAAVAAFLALFYAGFLVVFQIDIANDPRFFWIMFTITGLAASAGGVLLMDAMVRWSVFIQAVVIEGSGPVEALERSAALVRGNWLRCAAVLGLLLLVSVLGMAILGSLLNALLLPLGTLHAGSREMANGAAAVVGQVILSPVPAIGVTLLFYALRDGAAVWPKVEAWLRPPATI
ncbi:MAG: hypothetical protein HW416_3043 [Chloroflexi bacterium]|nr:hypothetical protein [Chloroflexota bacterium]